MDFLALATAAAAPPTSPTSGKASSPAAPSAGSAASDFAALMAPTSTPEGEPGQTMARPDQHGLSGTSSAGDDSGESAAPERPRAPRTNSPDVEAPRLDMIRGAREGAQAIGAAIGEDAPFGEPEQATAVGGEDAVAPEVVEAATVQATKSDPAAEVAPAPRQLIATPVPEPPALAIDAAVTGTAAEDQTQAPRPRTDPAQVTDATAMPAAVPASRRDVAIAGQVPRQGSELGLAAAGRPGTGPSALPPEVRATGPAAMSKPSPRSAAAGGGRATPAVERRHSIAAHEGAGGHERVRPQEISAALDGPSDAQARAVDPNARQVDVQPARLPQISGTAGTVAGSPPATGMPVELAQLVARTSDGAAVVEPGPHPATRQVMLQITKGLDQERTEIRIRLDPPELGEVDIQLEFRDLRLTASISAERADTLDLLQRDSRALARALREAGFELADSDLSFAANGRDDRPAAGSYAQRTTSLPRALSAGAAEVLPLPPAIPAGFVSLSDGRMDLRA